MPELTQQAKPAATKQYFLFRWAESPGSLRDALIVVFVFLYTLGVLTWSLSALETYIGFIQVFDAQYVVAGLIPAASIGVIYVFMSRVRDASAALDIRPDAQRLRQYYRDVSPILYLSFATLYAFDLLLLVIYNTITGEITPGLFAYLDRLNPALTHFLWYVICMLLTLSVLQWPWQSPRIPSFFQNPTNGPFTRVNYYVTRLINWTNYYAKRSTTLAVHVLPYIFLFLAVREYAYGIFPNMPQEIGGGQPRCALLHLQKGMVAEETVQALSESHALVVEEVSNYNAAAGLTKYERIRRMEMKGLADSDEVVQTREVRVVYHSDKSLFFQILDSDHHVSTDKGIFEIRRDAIPSIIWLKKCF